MSSSEPLTPSSPYPPLHPGDRVTWTEQRRKGRSLTLTTRTGTVQEVHDTYAVIATDGGRTRTVYRASLRPLAQKTELHENVEAVMAYYRKLSDQQTTTLETPHA